MLIKQWSSLETEWNLHLVSGILRVMEDTNKKSSFSLKKFRLQSRTSKNPVVKLFQFEIVALNSRSAVVVKKESKKNIFLEKTP